MINPLHIIEGHVNKALSNTPLANSEVEQLGAMRMKICMACKNDQDQPCLNVQKRCCICTCDMEAKTKVLDAKCPKSKW